VHLFDDTAGAGQGIEDQAAGASKARQVTAIDRGYTLQRPGELQVIARICAPAPMSP
jgi:hypothetical protein